MGGFRIVGASRESYNQISKLIDHHQFTMEKNKLLKEHIKSLEKTIKNLNKHLDDAKKTIQEKDKQLIELQSGLIQAYKSYINKKTEELTKTSLHVSQNYSKGKSSFPYSIQWIGKSTREKKTIILSYLRIGKPSAMSMVERLDESEAWLTDLGP